MVLRTTRSTVFGSQTPSATSAIASRHSACCSRLPMKPGTSRPTRTGSLPTWVSSATTRSAVSGAVRALGTTSTTGIRSGGFQKCVPITRLPSSTRSVTAPIGSTEVLVASTASGASVASRSKSSCLTARFSTTASITRSASGIAAARSAAAATEPRPAPATRAASTAAAWRISALVSVMATSRPAEASTPAMRRPISPAPTTAARENPCEVSMRCTRRPDTSPGRCRSSRRR
ncbi:Uncharacterised protein [Mycobacterium tuberculosis]|nr:3-hydroxybutyryl-CoA dehydrogenase FadB [Mycobacterium tuberculosis]CKT65042.1 Uncharacterised protein [Mycobacterium tuberculosis]CRG45517.1 Uncharacterised protein [Mycobacterium tuberculosis]